MRINGKGYIGGGYILLAAFACLTVPRPATADEFCTNDPGLPAGWRGCDDSDGWSGECARVAHWPAPPLAGSSFWADYASAIEAEDYLDSLEGASDHLALIDLGESPMFDLVLGDDLVDPPVRSGRLRVARIAEDPQSRTVTRPAILMVCGFHAHEWIPQEVCLGYVDYLVKAASGEHS